MIAPDDWNIHVSKKDYDAMEAQRNEARDAWAKANAECCELKERAERAEADAQKLSDEQRCVSCGQDICPPMQCGACIEREEPAPGMPERPVTSILRDERDEARRDRRDAILERNVAEGRIAAALEYVEKWGENCEGWAAILRGEDG